MEMKRMFVQVVNLTEGKVFSLPTLYTDRTEACVCGQNYIRDRQAENMSETLFFRVLDVHPDGSVAPSYDLWDDEDEDEDEEDEEEMPTCGNCDGDCQFCPTNYDVEDEDTEEPNYRELMEGILEVCKEYGANLVIPRT